MIILHAASIVLLLITMYVCYRQYQRHMISKKNFRMIVLLGCVIAVVVVILSIL